MISLSIHTDFHGRSFTSKRIPESSCSSTTIGIDLSDHGLLQLYNR
jgi:hypothetical protein